MVCNDIRNSFDFTYDKILDVFPRKKRNFKAILLSYDN